LWIPVITKKHRIFAKIANAVLRVIWLPMLIFSLVLSANAETDNNIFGMLAGLVVGMLVGMVFHEAGHMFACLAYGGRIFEVGVLLRFFMPGAYVMLDTSDIKVRMKRIQINAAGVEMNFLLTAIFGIIACCSYETSSFFAAAAGNNLIMGLLNLTFINGLDGMNIIGELLGIENFVARASKTLFNRKYRKKLFRKGVSGKAIATACIVICLAQMALPLIFAINILGVF
jgi:putative peptide zinc metalloprotease protein